MKQRALLWHLRVHGCSLNGEGRSYARWTNPQTDQTEAVPRHTEIPDVPARKICRGLSVTDAGRWTGSAVAFEHDRASADEAV